MAHLSKSPAPSVSGKQMLRWLVCFVILLVASIVIGSGWLYGFLSSSVENVTKKNGSQKVQSNQASKCWERYFFEKAGEKQATIQVHQGKEYLISTDKEVEQIQEVKGKIVVNDRYGPGVETFRANGTGKIKFRAIHDNTEILLRPLPTKK